MNCTQFDIYDVNLNPTQGSEQKGIRPCVILQTNAVSDLGRTTLIAPLTSRKLEKVYPYEVLVPATTQNGLKQKSKAKLDQIRVIDKTRVQAKRGTLEKEYTQSILSAMDIIFDREGDFR